MPQQSLQRKRQSWQKNPPRLPRKKVSDPTAPEFATTREEFEVKAAEFEKKAAESHNKYEAFIDAFGTHYASTVFYGGLGVLDIQSSEVINSTSAETSQAVKGEVSGALKALSAGGSYAVSTDVKNMNREELRRELDKFFWVGGTSVGTSREEWTIGLDGVVPVHVQLRPIDELLGPFYFDAPKITGDAPNGTAQNAS